MYALLTFLVLSLRHRVIAKQQGTPACDVDPGIDIPSVLSQAANLSSHSWEYGTAAEAMLEFYNPQYAVFSPSAFPSNGIPSPQPTIPALAFARPHISLNSTTLIDGDGASGDPASLGVSAILLGQDDSRYNAAATRQRDYLLYDVPRFPNGAISQRDDDVEAWADFMYMAPPFLAYAAVRDGNVTLLKDVVQQAGLYRSILRNRNNSSGYWHHIIPGADGVNSDPGIWSTGNGWAAMGMARVLATLTYWSPASNLTVERTNLVAWVKEIVDGAIGAGFEPSSGLLRNYLPNETWFGETSGTALLTATVYRMAVLEPSTFGETYLDWADERRCAVASHISNQGILSPAVNPLGWGDPVPVTSGSPEGQSFGAMLGTSYRDCVCAGVCKS